jgi:hypothetical protein
VQPPPGPQTHEVAPGLGWQHDPGSRRSWGRARSSPGHHGQQPHKGNHFRRPTLPDGLGLARGAAHVLSADFPLTRLIANLRPLVLRQQGCASDLACRTRPRPHQPSPSRGRIPACGCAPDRTQPRRPSLTQRRASLELTAMRMRTVIAAFINTRNLTSATALRSISCVTASAVHATMRAIRAQAW